MGKQKPIEIDGRTGEGGGQVVRVAIGISALTGQPVKITNIRGNRPKGGLASQHVTSIRWLADATDAAVTGLEVGSKTLTFIPKTPPTRLCQRNIKIFADSSAASTLLIVQAILPFLVFAGNESDEPITVEVSGGTNVSFSPSFEYFDQVFLPKLEERFGIKIERQVKRRGWSMGQQTRGLIWLKVSPLRPGHTLHFKSLGLISQDSYRIEKVNAIILAPAVSHEVLQRSIAKDLLVLYPDADVHFNDSEDSGSDSRWYILLVAHSTGGLRWAKDILCSMPKKQKSREDFTAKLSRQLCRGLYNEVSAKGHVDEHLQDQLICFQALAESFSWFPRSDNMEDAEVVDRVAVDEDSVRRFCEDARREKTTEPFGHGTLHSRTARWVVSELLAGVEFYRGGDVVRGIGASFE